MSREHRFRMYASHRRAWTPRFWPIALLGAAIVFATTQLAALTLLEAIALGVGVGLGVGIGRWELWKMRHPIITPAQYIEDLQRAARWN